MWELRTASTPQPEGVKVASDPRAEKPAQNPMHIEKRKRLTGRFIRPESTEAIKTDAPPST
jgi:hypothetical protein